MRGSRRGFALLGGLAALTVGSGAATAGRKQAPPSVAASGSAAARTVTIDANGKGDFRTVGEAIAAAPENSERPLTLRIRPGVYKEALVVPKTKPHLRFVGLGKKPGDTVLTFDRSARTLDNAGKPYGTSGSASTVLAGDDFQAENVTFANSAGSGDQVGQAVAVLVTGDKIVFRNCRFTGWQDTLYAGGRGGRQFYDRCFIEGSVDFIFGHGAAVFNRCEIRSVGKGYVTAQARDTSDEPGGYVFRDCKLTAAKDVPNGSVFLGRPWRAYARVAYMNCELGAHIRPEGWDNWRDPEKEKSAFFGEYQSKGPGASPRNRASWARQLTQPDLAPFETERFFARPDGSWKPR